jgi:hypothetical protein
LLHPFSIATGRTVSALICLLGYSTIEFVPVAFVSLLVGSRADIVVAAAARAVLFLRLNGNFGIFVSNIVLARVNGLTIFVTQRLLR